MTSLPAKTYEALYQAEERIGYRFDNPELLLQALTHASFSKSPEGEGFPDYERLEFLGDAVLELLSSEMLYRTFPWGEGRLTQRRARLVCEPTLSRVAGELRLGELMRFSHGEEKTGGRKRASILCDVLEAVLGAVYLDGGLHAAREMAERLLFSRQEELLKEEGRDYKSALQEKLQGIGIETPTYHMIKEEGPPHDRQFTMEVRADGKVLGTGVGKSKKSAAMKAAREALKEI